MILQRLCEYYDIIDADPSIEIAQAGFAPQKISFEIVLTDNGELSAVNDLRVQDGKRLSPRMMKLPFEGRTSGVKPMFLWDKAEYLLGYIPPEIRDAPGQESSSEKKSRLRKIERIESCFRAFKETHQSYRDAIDDAEYRTLCKFLSAWNPEQLAGHDREVLDEIATGFGVFRINAHKSYVHDSVTAKQFWVSRYSGHSGDDTVGTCLVTGESTRLARLHSSIKGVRDAQSSGASIVSFNKPSFESFAKHQSFNSPVGETSAFKYTTALSYLLEFENRRKLQIGDMTCVFWSDATDGVAEDLFNLGFDADAIEDESRSKEIGKLLHQARDGNAVLPLEGAKFYILGLSPNASRLSIRFWISDTAIDIVHRVAAHQKRLEIVRNERDSDWIPLWMILSQTSRDPKETPPILGGALLRSVLTGGPYPVPLLAAIIRRVRAEQDVRHVKAAVLKAILNHNYQMEISTMLDVDRPESAYQMGRLFAAIERAQEDALPGLNATIKDRYFGAASSTPRTVFPRLIRMSQHHLAKLVGGKKVVAEKRVQEIIGRISEFPAHLNLANQGLFAIGYYHQRQDFFKKKVEEPKSD